MGSLGCGSETSIRTVGPSDPRCAIQAQADTASFPATGGAGVLRIITNRECVWTVQNEASWLALQAEASGQGETSIRFNVAANSDPPTRSARLTVNDQGVQISQEGKACTFNLSSTRETVPASGEQRTIRVESSSALCQWTATSDVSWITIAGARMRSGSGDVQLEVAAIAGPARTGTVTIAGQAVEIAQGTACSAGPAMTTLDVGAEGGRFEVPVTGTAGCPWQAASQAAWIKVETGQSGSGSGTVVLQIDPTGQPRSGTIVIGGRTITVAQWPGCGVTLEPPSHTAAAGGGPGTITVGAAAGCSWTSVSSAPWIAITAGASGSGTGQVHFSVAANAGPPRTASLTIGGRTVAVTQSSGCAVTIQPASHAAPVGGSAASVTVAADAGCAWTAATNAPWVTITAGASGSGAGQVQFATAANTGPARTASLTVGGQSVAISQPSGCTFSVAPQTVTLSPAAQTGTLSLSTGAGCPWSAASAAPWLTLPQPSGTGPAQVSFAVGANNEPQRSGVLVVAGMPITLIQMSPCTWVLAPPDHELGPNGGRGNVLVIVGGPCAWTALSDASWITMEAGTSGVGNGLVQFIVAPNPGPARNGIVKIAGFDYLVKQAAK